MTTHELATRLQSLAKQLRKAPDGPVEWASFSVTFAYKEPFRTFAKMLGTFTKDTSEWFFTIQQGTSWDGFYVAGHIPRDRVCEMRTVTKTVEEWVCDPLMDEKGEATNA